MYAVSRLLEYKIGEMGVSMKTWELISIVLAAMVAGMFHGPWVALSRFMSTFAPEVFLAIVDRMNRNMAPVMTVLMPAALLSIIPVLLLSYHERPLTFYLGATAFALFIVALLVTVLVEVPIVEEIVTSARVHATAQLAATARSLDKVSYHSGDCRPCKLCASSSWSSYSIRACEITTSQMPQPDNQGPKPSRSQVGPRI